MAVRGDLLMSQPSQSTRAIIAWSERIPGEGGATWRFRLAWSTRLLFWTIDVSTGAGVALIRGAAIRTRADVFGPFSGLEGWPRGQLFAEDTTGQDREPSRDGWRREFRLVYRPAEIAAAVSGTADEVV